MHSRIVLLVLSMAACFAVTPLIHADCTDTSGTCTTNQTEQDTAAQNAYSQAYATATSNYTATVNSDYDTATQSLTVCLTTMTNANLENCLLPYSYNADGSYNYSAVESAYDSATNDCATNGSDFDQCICAANSQASYTIQWDSDMSAWCHAGVVNDEQQCFGYAYQTQVRADNTALGNLINDTWSAYAIEQKALLVASWAYSSCCAQAGDQYDDCEDDEACDAAWIYAPYSAVVICCMEACYNIYNDATTDDTLDFNDTVGPAQEDEVFKTITCGYTQMYNDQVAYTTETDAIMAEQIDYNYRYNDAANDYNHTVALDADTCALAEALCDCTNVTGIDCAAGPSATQQTNDAAALTEYQDADGGPNGPGYVWTDANQAYTNAVATYQATCNSDYNTETNCVANAQNDYQDVLDDANTLYNLEEYEAGEELNDNLQACNPQG